LGKNCSLQGASGKPLLTDCHAQLEGGCDQFSRGERKRSAVRRHKRGGHRTPVLGQVRTGAGDRVSRALRCQDLGNTCRGRKKGTLSEGGGPGRNEITGECKNGGKDLGAQTTPRQDEGRAFLIGDKRQIITGAHHQRLLGYCP